ncbi:xanthine dehydrogenase family protein molybdopterin-binding subunit [Pseudodesulfovibrio sp. zrk46]|uniref:xanthine dehydrogenase family protein molybdopterin-binding subunit n=1 Tax=Pseudodesulfovibrio sp. zrk46 TaxID=2725288 RepID=UPI0014496B8C|nr:xanthine dehydrogenase family protein molybdopterin-binding subunit [Pseudodesulfovibrio sp. zrk46]QJB57032.1 xanthine dehydrogenase family protein [Pseudodesulfovibrio sp. zrk46]
MPFSKNADRADTPGKCSGATAYVGDLRFDGMLEAVTVRSTIRRGKIKAIILPELPDGYYTVDASDIPDLNQVTYFYDPCPYFAEDEVRYIGQPILLVVGPDVRTVRRLAHEVRVEYETIPAIHTLDEALNGDKPPLHNEDNVYFGERFAYGDVDEAFSRAAEIFETETHTGYQEHLYLETQGVVAVPEEGRITVHASTQGPHAMRKVLAGAFGWEEERFRVRQTMLGGGFGGKIEPPFLLAGHASFAAHKCNRPVRLIYSREEDLLVTTKRHPSRVITRSALDCDGNILAVDVDVVFQAGGYALSCRMVLDTGLKKATGVYHFPAASVRGRAVATNNPMCGAYRGFGGPQTFFAIETHMNALARKLGREPLEFKAAYFTKQGGETLTGGKYHFHVALPETVEEATKLADYARRRLQPVQQGRKLRGIGQALFNFGAPFSLSTNHPLPERYMGLLKRTDGKVEILSELVDMGQGLHTALRKIVAHALEIPMERVVYEDADTDCDPEASITGASMSVVLFGQMLKDAADKLKPKLDEPGEFRVLEAIRQPEHLKWDAEKQQGDPFHSYVWGTVIAEVEVDTVTWQVATRKIWTALDVGTAIDRRIVKGQIDGGTIQGLGYSLLESMPPDGMTTSLADYVIPTTLDAPPVESALIANPYPPGPYGAKCVGEPPLVGVAPAIADAVANACGVEVWQLPVSPEYLMQAMANKS